MGKTTNGRIAIVTVHGTGDAAPGPNGDKWFQNGSVFATRLLQRLKGRGLEADIVPHLWSGANSAQAREQGAETLTKAIRLNGQTYDGVHVIGHSHGGNVANDAACMLNWSHKQRRPKIASVTTVGTPFLRAQVTRGERAGAWAFAAIVLLSVFFAAIGQDAMQASQVSFAARPWYPLEILSEGNEHSIELYRAQRLENLEKTLHVVQYLTIASILSLLVVMPLALRGIRRILRVGRQRRADTSIISIWHPHDEAIAFLHRLEGLPIEPFPRGSLWRGSRTGGILWGVRAVIATPIIGLLLLTVGYTLGRHLPNGATAPRLTDLALQFVMPGFAPNSVAEAGGNVLLWGLAGAPVLFASVYLAYRLFAVLALELGLRNTLNRMVGDSLKGIAFGRDGDNRVGEVAPFSHYYGVERVVLDGEVAQRMFANSTEATRRLFDKYRGGLFSVDIDESNAVAALAQDAMTWDSLIHTTYFDQPEIADMIGDQIATAARRK